MALVPRTGLYSVYPATFADSTVTNVTMTQLREVSVDLGSSITKKKALGTVDTLSTSLHMADPRIRIGSGDMDTVLGDFGINGQCWDQGLTIPAIERSACSTFRTGSIEPWYISDLGYVYVDTISADQSSAEGVQAQLIYVPFWDGTNEIVRMTSGNDTAGGTAPVFSSWYWPGPVRWADNRRLDGVISWELQSNTTYQTKREGGEPWARRGAIRQRDYVVRVRTNKIDAHARSLLDSGSDWGTSSNDPKLASLFLAPLLATGEGSLDLYLASSAAGGIRVADVTPSHIRIRCATAHGSMSEWSVAAEDDATATYEIHVVGTPAIAEGVAIPAAAAEAA